MLFAPEAVGVAAPEEATVKLDVINLIVHASWPVKIVVVLLVVSSMMVWAIAILKYMQLARMRAAAQGFEQHARRVGGASELFELANRERSSAGARVVLALYSRGTVPAVERLRAIADRAIVSERQRARSLLSPLASIASAAPFIGLFGTVYGIMDAFVRIGAAKSASLPVVAPSIGEALVTTAIGLAAAIPAVIFFNSIDKRVADFTSELEASAAEWVAVVADSNGDSAIPLVPNARAAGLR